MTIPEQAVEAVDPRTRAGELLPCPFCGTPPTVRHAADVGTHRISCQNEDCFGPYTTAAPFDDAKIQWNKRAPSHMGVNATREDIEKAVAEAMTDTWNEICSDTDCHPTDIEQNFEGKRGSLGFHPAHWARGIAMRLAALPHTGQPDAFVAYNAALERAAQMANRHGAPPQTVAAIRELKDEHTGQPQEGEAVTNEMCECALAADKADRIQGFTYQSSRNQHVIRDVWKPPGQQEIWKADIGAVTHDEFQHQCAVERMRVSLQAALSAAPASPRAEGK